MSIEAVKTDESVVLKVKMGGKVVNAILDSGAGCSVIDLGTLKEIGFEKHVVPTDCHLVNASGVKMDIAGVVHLTVGINGVKPVAHEFKVLNAKT